MGKACSCIGHRKIVATDDLKRKIDEAIEGLILDLGVTRFLFGSRSEFDSLCHERVTKMQEKYPNIKRVAYVCKSEYACKPEEKKSLEKTARAVLKREVEYLAYEEIVEKERVFKAGRASYVERNQEMINESDFCLFYYTPSYTPSTKGKSGTALAFAYAERQKAVGKLENILNLYD